MKKTLNLQQLAKDSGARLQLVKLPQQETPRWVGNDSHDGPLSRADFEQSQCRLQRTAPKVPVKIVELDGVPQTSTYAFLNKTTHDKLCALVKKKK